MTKKLIIVILAMSLFAVQGYAQQARGREGHSSRQSTRTERSYQPSREHSSRGNVAPSHRGNSSRGSYQPSREHSNRGNVAPSHRGNSSYGNYQPSRGHSNRGGLAPQQHPPRRNDGARHVAPPRHDYHNHAHSHSYWRPTFHHHHGYHHHHHHCIFDRWSWYTWGGYTNRFIRHSLYHNRYFDSMLGYYLWNSLDAPTRIDIGTMSFSRYQGRLKVVIGNNVSYLDMYRYQKVTYQVGYTFVEVTTNGGYATLYLYDEYGNSATYRI